MFPCQLVPTPRISALAMMTILAVTVARVSPALGQFSPQDQKIIGEYRLTQPTFSKFAKATENYIAVLKDDPSLLKQFRDEASEQSEEAAGAPAFSIDGIASDFERLPALRRAITSAGLTPREFATISLAAAFANLARHSLEQGSTKPSAVERDNIELLKKNEAEVTRLNKLTMWLEQTN